MNPRGIPMANRCWLLTRTLTMLTRTPGWHGGRKERMCCQRSVEFQKTYMILYMAVPTHTQVTGGIRLTTPVPAYP